MNCRSTHIHLFAITAKIHVVIVSVIVLIPICNTYMTYKHIVLATRNGEGETCDRLNNICKPWLTCDSCPWEPEEQTYCQVVDDSKLLRDVFLYYRILHVKLYFYNCRILLLLMCGLFVSTCRFEQLVQFQC